MPVYQLLGGKCREAAASYTSVGGDEVQQVIDAAQGHGAGLSHIRLADRRARHVGLRRGRRRRAANASKVAAQGSGLRARPLHPARGEDASRSAASNWATTSNCCTTSTSGSRRARPSSSPRTSSRSSSSSWRTRSRRRTSPTSARSASSAPPRSPWASSFNSPHEWTPLIAERLIDYIRIHISQAGGLTPCRKIAILGELFGVKTAWHGPGDVSPIGHMCNLHLDLASFNFGVQEGGVIRGRRGGDLQGLRDLQGRLSLRQRFAGLGHRGGREAGRQVSLPRRRRRGT